MSETKKCPYCGEEIKAEAIKCRYCQSMLNNGHMPPPPSGGNYGGYQWQGQQPPQQPYGQYVANDPFAVGPEGKSRGITALLAIFLGWLGIHYFYLGKNTGGIVFLLISVLSCCSVTSILGLIQGIMMFCMTNEDSIVVMSLRHRHSHSDSDNAQCNVGSPRLQVLPTLIVIL